MRYQVCLNNCIKHESNPSNCFEICGSKRYAAEEGSAKVARAESPSEPKRARPLVVSLYSVAGGVGRTTLAVALAAALKARGVEPVIVEGDFEGASLFHLVDRWAPNARDLYTLTLWGFPVTPGDLSVIRVGGYEVRALVINPEKTNLVDLTTRVAAAWGTVSTARATLRRRLRRVLESAAEAAGASVVLLDARSGLAVPSLDMIAASDVLVVVSKPDPLTLARTAVALKQIGEELHEMRERFIRTAIPALLGGMSDGFVDAIRPLGVEAGEPVVIPVVPKASLAGLLGNNEYMNAVGRLAAQVAGYGGEV